MAVVRSSYFWCGQVLHSPSLRGHEQSSSRLAASPQAGQSPERPNRATQASQTRRTKYARGAHDARNRMQHDLAKCDADCLHGAAPACRGGLAARQLERKQEREGVPVNNT
jgi:uncharacterized protein (DUF58 family)